MLSGSLIPVLSDIVIESCHPPKLSRYLDLQLLNTFSTSATLSIWSPSLIDVYRVEHGVLLADLHRYGIDLLLEFLLLEHVESVPEARHCHLNGILCPHELAARLVAQALAWTLPVFLAKESTFCEVLCFHGGQILHLAISQRIE